LKLSLLTLLIFLPIAGFSVCNKDLDTKPKIPSSIVELNLTDCLKVRKDGDKACACSKKNEKFNFHAIQPDYDNNKNIILKNMANNALDVFKRSMVQITHNISMLNESTGLKTLNGACSLNKFKKINNKCGKLNNSIFNLLNESKQPGVTFLDKIGLNIGNELALRKGSFKPDNTGFISRDSYDMPSCNLSDADALKYGSRELIVASYDIFSLIDETLDYSKEILPQLKSKANNLKDKAESQRLVELIEKSAQHPIVSTLYQTPSLLMGTQNQIMSPENYVKTLQSPEILNLIAEKAKQTCSDTYSELENFLCSPKDKISSNYKGSRKLLKSTRPKDNLGDYLGKETEEYLEYQIQATQKLHFLCHQESVFQDSTESTKRVFSENIPAKFKNLTAKNYAENLYVNSVMPTRKVACDEILPISELASGQTRKIYREQDNTDSQFLLSPPSPRHSELISDFLGEYGEDEGNSEENQDSIKLETNDIAESINDIKKNPLSQNLSSSKTKQISNNSVAQNKAQKEETSIYDTKELQAQSFASNDTLNANMNNVSDSKAMSGLLDQIKRRMVKKNNENQLSNDVKELSKLSDNVSKNSASEHQKRMKELKDLFDRSNTKTPQRNNYANSTNANSTNVDTTNEDSDPDYRKIESDYAKSFARSNTSSGRSSGNGATNINSGKTILGKSFGNSEIQVKVVANSDIDVRNETIKEIELHGVIEENLSGLDMDKMIKWDHNQKQEIEKLISLIKEDRPFVISKKGSKKHRVLVTKTSIGYSLKPYGSMGDPEFLAFYENIEKALKENTFKKLIDGSHALNY